MATTTRWSMQGRGYEFCNCDFGCGCNFSGVPSSKDGSCRALVGVDIDRGSCGDVDLSGVKCAGIFDWPKAIHEGNGKCAFVVDPSVTDAQVEALAGVLNLLWIALISAFVIAEKTLPGGALVGHVAGVALVTAGVLQLAQLW